MPARPRSSRSASNAIAQPSKPSVPVSPGQTLIVASNRGPVEFYRAADGRLSTRRGAGGVVRALATFARDVPLTWVATTMSNADRNAFSRCAGASAHSTAGPPILAGALCSCSSRHVSPLL